MKYKSNYTECYETCFNEDACDGYAISEKSNACYVYGNITLKNESFGWKAFPQNPVTIDSSSNSIGVRCYKRSGDKITLLSIRSIQ